MKNAIVTGAARGMGLAICKTLLQRQYSVVGVDIDGEQLAATSEQLTDQGFAFTTRVADLTDPDNVAALFESVAQTHGGSAR